MRLLPVLALLAEDPREARQRRQTGLEASEALIAQQAGGSNPRIGLLQAKGPRIERRGIQIFHGPAVAAGLTGRAMPAREELRWTSVQPSSESIPRHQNPTPSSYPRLSPGQAHLPATQTGWADSRGGAWLRRPRLSSLRLSRHCPTPQPHTCPRLERDDLRMKILVFFTRAYPWQSATVFACMLVAGVLGGLGWSTVLPVLGVAINGPDVGAVSGFEARVIGALQEFGIPLDLGPLVAVMSGAFALKAGILLFANGRVGYTVAHIATDLRLRLLRALMAARWGHFTKLPLGTVANAMATEANRASNAYRHAVQVLTHVLEALVAGSVALAVSWQVTLVAIAAGAVSMTTLHGFVRMAGRAGHRQTRLLRSLLGRMTDVLHAVKMLKATGRESLMGPLLEEDALRLKKALKKQVVGREALRTLQEPILMFFLGAGLLVGIQVAGMPASGALVLIILFARTMTTLNQAQRKYQGLVIDESALWSLLGMIEAAEAERESLAGIQPPSLEQGVELCDVHVESGGRVILKGLNVEIPAAGVTAILGPSGAGKTTLVDLIAGLTVPTRGEVLIDGTPLVSLDLHQWRQQIGYVPQEMLLLHDSVRHNVTLGDPALSDADVERALREAGVWGVVSQLPDGLDASVGERGSLLSGGQCQRIAIARALVHRPRLLILDEATASLDADSESEVWNSVAALRGHTTVVAISHRMSVTTFADRIYRLEDGVAIAMEIPAVTATDAARR